MLAFALGPVLGAPGAHKNEVESIFCRLSEDHCLCVAAPFAADALSAFQCWILHALWVDLNVFCAHRKVSPIDTVVHLIVLLRPLIAVAEFAFKLEKVASFVSFVLFGLEHIVTLGTKSNAFKLGCCLSFNLRLLRHHSLLLLIKMIETKKKENPNLATLRNQMKDMS